MTLELIKKQIVGGNEEERRAAAEALASLKGKDAMGLLISALGDASWRVRKTAEAALEGFLEEECLITDLILCLSSEENAGLRNSAAAVLAKIGGPAVPCLVEILGDTDEDIRKFGADILGDIRDARAVPSLVGALRDPDDNVRTSAAEALGKIGGDEVVNALVSILGETEGDLWLRFSAIEALGKAGKDIPLEPIVRLLDDRLLRKAAFDALGRSGDPRAAIYLVSGFKDKGRGSREAAVNGFAGIYKKLPESERERVRDAVKAGGDVRMLTELLDSPLPETRKGALSVLAIIGEWGDPCRILALASDERMQEAVSDALVNMGDQGLQALVDSFPKSEERMRAYICTVLGRMGDEKALKTLISALSDSYGHTRHAAALAISGIGSVDALSHLFPLLSDEYEDVEEAAVEAIIKIGKGFPGDVTSRLKDRITSQDPRIRRNITTILGRVGGREALAVVAASLKDEDRDVRRAAASAIGSLMQEGGIDHLALALSDEESQVRLAAVHSLGWFRNEEAKRLLLLASGDEDIWVRCAALKGLSNIGGDDAEKLLTSAVTDEVGVVAIAAIEALSALKGAAAVPVIKEGLKHMEPDVVRVAEKTLRKLQLT